MFDNVSGKAIADVITLHDELIDESKPYEIFHPVFTWKRKTLTNFTAKKLLVKIFDKGICVYENPNVHEIQQYCKDQLDLFWDEVKRFDRPHRYFVDLSQDLWDIKDQLLKDNR